MHGTVMLVDDDAMVRDYLESVLSGNDYPCVGFSDGPSALEHLAHRRDEVSVIVSDISMPIMNGLEFLNRVRSRNADMPFILLSGMYDTNIAIEAYTSGSTDHLLKPVSEEDLLNMVGKYARHSDTWDQENTRRQLAALHAALSRTDWSDLDSEGNDKLRQLFESMGRRRFETLQHSQRVAAFTRMIGSYCGVRGKDLKRIQTGALLHDIGKVAIPQNVIEKPGCLSEEEWRIIKLHPAIGAGLLSGIPGYSVESDIILCHHERVDGKGYPNAIKDAWIPIGARIFAVADTLDAICSVRPYRQSAGIAVARAEIEKMSGSQFDPAVVNCLRCASDAEIREIQDLYREPETTVVFR